MPRRRSFPFAPIAIAALASLLLAGCTALGFGIGALSDHSAGKKPVAGLSDLRTGTHVTVWVTDGRKIDGVYLGFRDSLVAPPLPMPTAAELGNVVPFGAVVVLGTVAGAQQLPVEDVRQVSVPVARGKWIGLMLGALADAAFVYFASWDVYNGEPAY